MIAPMEPGAETTPRGRKPYRPVPIPAHPHTQAVRASGDRPSVMRGWVDRHPAAALAVAVSTGIVLGIVVKHGPKLLSHSKPKRPLG